MEIYYKRKRAAYALRVVVMIVPLLITILVRRTYFGLEWLLKMCNNSIEWLSDALPQSYEEVVRHDKNDDTDRWEAG